MQKIISLFCRNYDTDHLVRNEVVHGAEWVLAGEGIPTRKWDGTCCLIQDGVFYKRFELKQKKHCAVPAGFIAAQDPDPITGDQPGWVPVGDGPEDAIHREALQNYRGTHNPGTYELVGPKINKNPEKMIRHTLALRNCPMPHGILNCFANIFRTWILRVLYGIILMGEW